MLGVCKTVYGDEIPPTKVHNCELNPISGRKQQGFSLLELLLVIALSGPIIYAGLSTHSYFWAKAWQAQLKTRETQNFYALGHWLVRDLRYELQNYSSDFQWREQNQCLLFANKGVRLRNQQLQWKPNEGDCTSNGWLGLHDASGFKVTSFDFFELNQGYFQVCISGEVNGELDVDTPPLQWCYSWHRGLPQGSLSSIYTMSRRAPA